MLTGSKKLSIVSRQAYKFCLGFFLVTHKLRGRQCFKGFKMLRIDLRVIPHLKIYDMNNFF